MNKQGAFPLPTLLLLLRICSIDGVLGCPQWMQTFGLGVILAPYPRNLGNEGLWQARTFTCPFSASLIKSNLASSNLCKSSALRLNLGDEPILPSKNVTVVLWFIILFLMVAHAHNPSIYLSNRAGYFCHWAGEALGELNIININSQSKYTDLGSFRAWHTQLRRLVHGGSCLWTTFSSDFYGRGKWFYPNWLNLYSRFLPSKMFMEISLYHTCISLEFVEGASQFLPNWWMVSE